MLRITRISDPGGSVCLKVEGRLTGDWVALLAGELEVASRSDATVSLDLAAVDFASSQGTALLRAATARGVRLRACSPFLANLLAVGTP